MPSGHTTLITPIKYQSKYATFCTGTILIHLTIFLQCICPPLMATFVLGYTNQPVSYRDCNNPPCHVCTTHPSAPHNHLRSTIMARTHPSGNNVAFGPKLHQPLKIPLSQLWCWDSTYPPTTLVQRAYLPLFWLLSRYGHSPPASLLPQAPTSLPLY